MTSFISSCANFVAEHTGLRAAVGVCGVRLSILGWKKLEDWTGYKLGPLLTKIPESIQRSAYFGTVKLLKPQNWVTNQVDKISPHLSSIVVAPLMEEGVFRGLMVIGGTYVLSSMGCPPVVATLLTNTVSSFMFGMGHSPFVDQDRFISTAIGGFDYGLIAASNGITDAALTHMLHNTYTTVMPKIMGREWFAPRWDKED